MFTLTGWIDAGQARIRAHGDHDAQLAAAFTIVLACLAEDFRQRCYDLDNPVRDIAILLRDVSRDPRLTDRPAPPDRRRNRPD